MNTTALFVELLVIGFGVGFWLVLLVIAAFGLPGFAASGSTLFFTALPTLATLYVLGIVWDRIADALFQRYWGDALRAAYFAGYYEWPRRSTAEEIADSMGVSSPTLHNHLRKAQQKLLVAFLDEE